jgi:hypothetical protein
MTDVASRVDRYLPLTAIESLRGSAQPDLTTSHYSVERSAIGNVVIWLSEGRLAEQTARYRKAWRLARHNARSV